uniref:Uncharacterized protein n=1 Tax=Siphoviridae sp. ct6rT12 TaxID=2825346 RepID=A0A8S5V9J3_9CAUD|nr:MAG TPA: hypothetical protein [Siphoviridae sp. ct6rT12]
MLIKIQKIFLKAKYTFLYFNTIVLKCQCFFYNKKRETESL